MAAWSVFLGFAAILLVFRTTDWRGLISQAQEDADQDAEVATTAAARVVPARAARGRRPRARR